MGAYLNPGHVVGWDVEIPNHVVFALPHQRVLLRVLFE